MSFFRDFAYLQGMLSVLISVMLFFRLIGVSEVAKTLIDRLVDRISIRLILSVSFVSSLWSMVYCIGQMGYSGVNLKGLSILFLLGISFLFTFWFGCKKVRWRQ